MSSQKTPTFNTFDVMMMLVLCGLVSSIAGALLAQGFQDNRVPRALAGAEALALQLKSQHQQALIAQKPVNTRSPASVDGPGLPFLTDGTMGRDPWGRPYRYFVQQGLAEAQASIFVWSDGPNGRIESQPELLSPAASSNGSNPDSSTDSNSDSPQSKNRSKFGGDDLGFIATFIP